MFRFHLAAVQSEYVNCIVNILYEHNFLSSYLKLKEGANSIPNNTGFYTFLNIKL